MSQTIIPYEVLFRLGLNEEGQPQLLGAHQVKLLRVTEGGNNFDSLLPATPIQEADVPEVLGPVVATMSQKIALLETQLQEAIQKGEDDVKAESALGLDALQRADAHLESKLLEKDQEKAEAIQLAAQEKNNALGLAQAEREASEAALNLQITALQEQLETATTTIADLQAELATRPPAPAHGDLLDQLNTAYNTLLPTPQLQLRFSQEYATVRSLITGGRLDLALPYIQGIEVEEDLEEAKQQLIALIS